MASRGQKLAEDSGKGVEQQVTTALGELRCLACDWPLLRYVPGTRSKSIMVACPHCRTLQHRHLEGS